MEITINGPVTEKTSYGITVLNIVESLSRLGHKINLVPVGGRADFLSDRVYTKRALDNYESGFNLNAPAVRIYHQHSLYEHVGRGLNVGFPIFELDRFSKLEVSSLNSCDLLFVPSEWGKSVFEANNIQPASTVVPLGVDMKVFNPTNPVRPHGKPFTFFFPGKFEYRKGFDIVVEVFEKAFNVTDNFEVLFLPNNHFLTQEQTSQWITYLTGSKFGNKFKLIAPQNSPSDVAKIVNDCDCIVSFSRAEGWNLPLLEGLACGKPVVATNYSAQTEFLDSSNSTLINVENKEEAFDGVFFHGGGSWLAFDESTVNKMAKAVKEAYNRGPVFNEEGLKTAQSFTWHDTASKIIDKLKQVAFTSED